MSNIGPKDEYSSTENKYSRGDRVYAQRDIMSSFKAGKILTAHQNGLFDVVFDDNTDAVDLPADMIRHLITDDGSGGSQSKAMKNAANGKENDQRLPVLTTAPVTTPSIVCDPNRKYHVGDQVEARREGKSAFRYAVIARVLDDGLHYEVVYSDRFRETLTAADIHMPDDLTPSASAAARAEKMIAQSSVSTTSSQATAKAAVMFSVGMEVEARFQGGRVFYPGTITSLDLGKQTASIKYSDGDVEDDVPLSYILPPQLPAKFAVGSKIEANYKNTGKWYPGIVSAVIQEAGELMYTVAYNDGDTDEGLREDALREPVARAPRSAVPSANANASSADAHNGGNPQQTHRRLVPAQQPATANDLSAVRIEANFHGRGHWFPGRLARERSNGNVDVVFDDGDFEDDVPLENIRRVLEPGEGQAIEVGARVEAKFRNGSQYFPGKIVRCATDQTMGFHYVDVQFDDGDIERGIPVERVHRISAKSSNNKTSEDANSSRRAPRVERMSSVEDMGNRYLEHSLENTNALFADSLPRAGSLKNKGTTKVSVDEEEAIDEEIATALLVEGTLVEVLDQDKRWHLGKVLGESHGLIDVKLLSGEVRNRISLTRIRLPQSLSQSDNSNVPTYVGTNSNKNPPTLTLDVYNLEALRALLRSKDEEIERLNQLLKSMSTIRSNMSTDTNNETKLEISQLKKANEDLKQSVLFLGEKCSAMIDEFESFKTKFVTTSKTVQSQNEEIQRINSYLRTTK